MSARMDGIPWIPRGLSRDEAAYYIGVGTSKFDQMVNDGRMPRGKRIDGRVVWDRVQLDIYFSDLGAREAAVNPVDAALQGHRFAR